MLISFLFQVYIYKVDKKEKISDNPSNFTIMVTNLPQNTEYNELRDEIERELNGNKEKNRDNLETKKRNLRSVEYDIDYEKEKAKKEI